MTDFLFGLVFGVGFLGAAWWMTTHEFWSTSAAREAAEGNPARWRQVNHKVEIFVTRRLAPLGLGILGLVTLGWGVSRLFT